LRRTHFPSFPFRAFRNKREKLVMRGIRKLIFAVGLAAMLVAAPSLFAQGEQDKKPPKNPPVVNPGNKPPPTPAPKKP